MSLTLRIFTLIFTTFILSSCGFSLRGSNGAIISNDTVYVQSTQDSSALTQALTSALNDAQLRIVDSASSAHYVLQISDEELSSRTTTVNGRARAAQYNLQLSTRISLSQRGTVLLEDEPLDVERSYFEDTANIAGSTQEIEILQEEMRRELVEQVMRRLRAAVQGV